jgi:hypothetical protein
VTTLSEEIVPHRSQSSPANLAKGLDPDQAVSASMAMRKSGRSAWRAFRKA